MYAYIYAYRVEWTFLKHTRFVFPTNIKYRVRQNKVVVVQSFFAVFSATVWHFKLKFYAFIYSDTLATANCRVKCDSIKNKRMFIRTRSRSIAMHFDSLQYMSV